MINSKPHQIQKQILITCLCGPPPLTPPPCPRAAHQFPHEVFNKAWETGLVNAHIPTAYGGLGLHTVEGCVIGEELAYGCSGISTAIEANTLAQMPLILAGSDAIKKK